MSRALVSLLLGVAFLAGARLTPAKADGFERIDRHEVRRFVDRIRKDDAGRQPALDAAKVVLDRDGVSEKERTVLVSAIGRRLERDLVAYARSLEGRTFPIIEDAMAAIQARERILRYNASSWPKGYGEGRPLRFTVDRRDADRMLLGVDGTIRARERSLRDAVRDLAVRGDLNWSDVRALRDFSRSQAHARARKVVDDMRGASFFSESDASFYLENAIDAELEAIRVQIEDPVKRTLVLDHARTGLPVTVN